MQNKVRNYLPYLPFIYTEITLNCFFNFIIVILSENLLRYDDLQYFLSFTRQSLKETFFISLKRDRKRTGRLTSASRVILISF